MAARYLHVTSPLTARSRRARGSSGEAGRAGLRARPARRRLRRRDRAAAGARSSATGLAADGIVGPQTREAIERQRTPGRSRPRRKPGTLGQRALGEAAERPGRGGAPASSNRTTFGRWFGVDGVKWCNIFVSYCFAVGAGYTICDGFRGAGVVPERLRVRPHHGSMAAGERAVGGRTTPRAGDIAIFNWDGGVPSTSASSRRASAEAGSPASRATPRRQRLQRRRRDAADPRPEPGQRLRPRVQEIA